jgi:hypothetical protein
VTQIIKQTRANTSDDSANARGFSYFVAECNRMLNSLDSLGAFHHNYKFLTEEVTIDIDKAAKTFDENKEPIKRETLHGLRSRLLVHKANVSKIKRGLLRKPKELFESEIREPFTFNSNYPTHTTPQLS